MENSMDFDDGRGVWARLEQQLDEQLGPIRRAIGRLETGGLRRRLNRLQMLLCLEIVVGSGLALMLGSYVADRSTSASLLVAGASLQVVVILVIVSAAHQLALLARLDYSEPVVGIQRRLAVIRVARTRARRWLLVAAPLLWTPLAIVAADALFGFDLPGGFGLPWILANLGLGAVVLIAAIVASRRADGRRDWWPVLTYMADDLAGRTLRSAARDLDATVEFGGES